MSAQRAQTLNLAEPATRNDGIRATASDTELRAIGPAAAPLSIRRTKSLP